MRRDEDARPANSIKTQPSVINPVKYAFTSLMLVRNDSICWTELYILGLLPATRTLTVAAAEYGLAV